MMMKYALVLTSAVFFWWPILSVWVFHPILWVIVMISTGVISLIGSVLLLFESGTDSTRRYLNLPFSIDILALLVTGLLSFYYSRSFPMEPLGELWAFSLLILSPCATAVIFSIPRDGRFRETSIYIVAIISAYSAITAILLLFGGYIPMLGLLYFYWMLGMPIIGVVFLVNAWYWPSRSAEKLSV
jgi:hypothetical protein